jgi:CCR4-NOT transcription complex subunit 3
MNGDPEIAAEWLRNKVTALKAQIQHDNKRKKSKGKAKKQELEGRNERRRWHMERLEFILQRLNNGSLSVNRVYEIQDDVNSYVNDNTVRLLSLSV